MPTYNYSVGGFRMLSNDGFRLIGVVYVIIGITFGYNLPIYNKQGTQLLKPFTSFNPGTL